jgi:peptidoglycan hydrolase-like protein with peptidoglycan-binding domain
MKAVTAFSLNFALLVGLTLFAVSTAQAQTTETTRPDESKQAQTAETARSEESKLESVNLVITSKEVSAVQAALLGRGYYNARPNGVLDGSTREAIRAYQTDNKLEATGKIDRATLESLEISYPATGKEANSGRRNGVLPKIGYATKDSAVATKDAATGTTRKVANTTKAGYDKTVEKTTGALNRGKEVTVGVGESTTKGAKTAAHKTQGAAQRTSDAVVGRSDVDIHTQVRDILNADPETKKFVTSVKSGNVTVKLTPGYEKDYSNLIASIRRLSGVKSVVVVQP